MNGPLRVRPERMRRYYRPIDEITVLVPREVVDTGGDPDRILRREVLRRITRPRQVKRFDIMIVNKPDLRAGRDTAYRVRVTAVR